MVIGSVVLDEFWGVVSRLLRIGSERVGSWGVKKIGAKET